MIGKIAFPSNTTCATFSAVDDSCGKVQTGRTLYLSRHGESLYNLDQRIGGNPELSERGHKYATALANTIDEMAISNLQIWTSELVRTHQTVAHIKSKSGLRHLAELNELDSGLFDHLTYTQFELLHPTDFAAREINKLTYRYPNGESYVDLFRRVEPVLSELDGHHNLLVVAHQAVLRCIISFLRRNSTNQAQKTDETPYIRVPLHTLIKVTFNGNYNEFEFIPMGVDCVSTHRPIFTPGSSTQSALATSSSDEDATNVSNLLSECQNQQQQQNSGTITCAN